MQVLNGLGTHLHDLWRLEHLVLLRHQVLDIEQFLVRRVEMHRNLLRALMGLRLVNGLRRREILLLLLLLLAHLLLLLLLRSATVVLELRRLLMLIVVVVWVVWAAALVIVGRVRWRVELLLLRLIILSRGTTAWSGASSTVLLGRIESLRLLLNEREEIRSTSPRSSFAQLRLV